MSPTRRPRGKMLLNSNNLLIKLWSTDRPGRKASVLSDRNYSVKVSTKSSGRSLSTVLREDFCLWESGTNIKWHWRPTKLCTNPLSVLACSNFSRLKRGWMSWVNSWRAARNRETNSKRRRSSWYRRRNRWRRRSKSERNRRLWRGRTT